MRLPPPKTQDLANATMSLTARGVTAANCRVTRLLSGLLAVVLAALHPAPVLGTFFV